MVRNNNGLETSSQKTGLDTIEDKGQQSLFREDYGLPYWLTKVVTPMPGKESILFLKSRWEYMQCHFIVSHPSLFWMRVFTIIMLFSLHHYLLYTGCIRTHVSLWVTGLQTMKSWIWAWYWTLLINYRSWFGGWCSYWNRFCVVYFRNGLSSFSVVLRTLKISIYMRRRVQIDIG